MPGGGAPKTPFWRTSITSERAKSISSRARPNYMHLFWWFWGQYDRFISIKLGHEIAARLPNARLEVIDKSGHYVHMDKPQELAIAVIQFLAED